MINIELDFTPLITSRSIINCLLYGLIPFNTNTTHEQSAIIIQYTSLPTLSSNQYFTTVGTEWKEVRLDYTSKNGYFTILA